MLRARRTVFWWAREARLAEISLFRRLIRKWRVFAIEHSHDDRHSQRARQIAAAARAARIARVRRAERVRADTPWIAGSNAPTARISRHS